MKIIKQPSPNFDARPANTRIDLIIIHATAGKSDAADLEWLTSKKSRVSCHYLIGRTGSVFQLVDEEKRAWHAGYSEWKGRKSCNAFSIGIELCNRGDGERYRPEQYTALGQLVSDIVKRRSIPLERIVGHCHVSPGRKTDPYLHFEWMWMAAAMDIWEGA